MKRSRGFTLIELMIVLAIVGIFVSLISRAVTVYFGGPGQHSSSPQAQPGAASTSMDPVEFLQRAGFSSVRVTVNQPSGLRDLCMKNGGAAYDVAAFNTAHEQVSLVVCCGGTQSLDGCAAYAR